ncbi:MAG: DNA sulfur modification protein DndD [Ruminococcus flavefaciens]|nr:DNA sulfur modification protein DndD [Ruminococcus flavefaciens]
MVIKELLLYNFGIYASANKFEFRGEKPVVLIGGMNGRGKTTILEAVLLALYGANSFAYQESGYQSYGQYLKSFVNAADGTMRTYIELEFLIDHEKSEMYRVRRGWDGNKKRTAENISVYKDGEYNEFLTSNWTMFIENILPSGLSRFFFFDGEKIAKLAAEKTSKQMKESIKSLLGISVLDFLEHDIRKIFNRVEKNRVNDTEIEEIEQLRKEKDDEIEELNLIDYEIERICVERKKIEKRIEKLHQDYSKKGGDLVNQRQEFFQKKSSVMHKIENMKGQLIDDAASELPMVLVRDLLMNIKENAEIAQDEKMMRAAFKKISRLLEDFSQKSSDSKGAQEFMDYVRQRSINGKSAPSYNLSDTAIFKLQVLLEKQLLNNKLSIRERQEEFAQLQEEAKRLDNYLSVDIDEKDIDKIYKKMKEAEQKNLELSLRLDDLQGKRHVCNGYVKRITSAYNKKVEEYLKRVELNEDRDRIIRYSHMAVTILDEYKIRLQRRKVDTVAKTMTDCYKKLANKKDMIERIEMDSNSLDLKYIDKFGKEVERSSLSAGEKQLMVISLLWALALCSKRKLPVIIDTPLSRLDSVHRVALIKTYFPQASEQTIILSTDSEIDRSYYDMMKEDIGDEYTLKYDEKTRSTTIVKGYFVEEMR